MIGQEELLRIIERIDYMPRFIILQGEAGAGKSLVLGEIAKKLGAQVIAVDKSTERVREAIELSYAQDLKTIYHIQDAESAHTASLNALLKVTEEPPRNAYFAITVRNLFNLPPTLRSRGIIFTLEPYKEAELDRFMNIEGIPQDQRGKLLKTCRTPGQIKTLVGYGVEDFYNFVQLVIDNIHTASSANVFKIVDRVSTKKEDGKYCPRLFLNAFQTLSFDRFLDTSDLSYLNSSELTSLYAHQLDFVGVHRGMLLDGWIMAIRAQALEA